MELEQESCKWSWNIELKWSWKKKGIINWSWNKEKEIGAGIGM